MVRSRLLPLLATLALLGACAHASTSSEANVTYGSDAKQNYDNGVKELQNKNYPEAEKYFEFVSARYPYSGFAALSELGAADTLYQEDKFIEAIDKYKNFLKMHPTHPKCDYAAFQVAQAYYEQIPSDFVILPSSAEKDQTDVKNALQSYSEFLTQFPSSELRPKAEARVVDLRHRLADHEMRIGGFYEEHERFPAAAGRYETVLRDYGGAGFDGAAAFRLYKLYNRMQQPEKAKDALQRLVKEHPQDPRAAEARRVLGQG